MLIDSHVNLHAPQFDEDRQAVIDRARAAGVDLMVTISDRVSNTAKVLEIAEANADIWATVGTHPHEAKEDPALSGERLAELAVHPRVVGIGETGLDFHYDLSPRNVQADDRVSLLVQEAFDRDDVQSRGRLTVMGRAELIPEPDVGDARARYLERLPSAQGYFATHDFSFYRINVERLRYIGGFGKIFWLDRDAYAKRA